MQDFLEASQTKIAEICVTHRVRRLAVFGSAVRDDFDSERSDVDLLVEFERFDDSNPLETYFRLQEALEEVFERKVDLIEAGSVRNPYIQRAIERDEKTLYAA